MFRKLAIIVAALMLMTLLAAPLVLAQQVGVQPDVTVSPDKADTAPVDGQCPTDYTLFDTPYGKNCAPTYLVCPECDRGLSGGPDYPLLGTDGSGVVKTDAGFPQYATY